MEQSKASTYALVEQKFCNRNICVKCADCSISPGKRYTQLNISHFSTKTSCGYSLEAPQQGASKKYPQLVFAEKCETGPLKST